MAAAKFFSKFLTSGAQALHRSTYQRCISKFPVPQTATKVDYSGDYEGTRKAKDNKKDEQLTIPDPLKHPDFFEIRNLFTMTDLVHNRVHFGHTAGTLNKHMEEFIFGSRLGTLIFDLDKTAEHLRSALNFIAHIAFRDGIILFVTRYKAHTYVVEKTALECKEFSHTKFWQVGQFTDAKRYGMMTRLPDLAIFLNTLDNGFEIHHAVIETNKLLIPSVGIVDSNCFPNYITYPIPGNDDSLEAINLYCKLFKLAILKGKKKRQEYVDMYGDDFETKFGK